MDGITGQGYEGLNRFRGNTVAEAPCAARVVPFCAHWMPYSVFAGDVLPAFDRPKYVNCSPSIWISPNGGTFDSTLPPG